jgi:sn-glycerol 3-phosphate transport system substrate-binding protein
MRRRSFITATSLAALSACDRRASRPRGEVHLWFTYGGRNRKVLLELVKRFNREQSRVRVVPTFQGDYFEGLVKLRTGMFVGSVPTISHVVGEVLPYLAQAQALATLEGIGDEVLDDLEPALAQSGTFVGGAKRPLVALPFNRSTPVAYLNGDVLRDLGLKPPADWAALRTFAARVSSAAKTGAPRWGFECPIDWWFWVALTGQAGGQVIEPDGRISLGDKAGVAALRLWQQLVHEDRSMKPPPGRDFNAWQVTNTDFQSGKVAMIWTSTAFLNYLESTCRFPVVAAPLPAQERHSVPTGGTFFVMPRGLPEHERQDGLRFLRWMMQPEQANAWATQTGYMPVSLKGRAKLETQGFFKKHPNYRVTLDQLKVAQPWPFDPKLFRVQREAVQPRLEQAVLQRRDAKAMLDAARRSVEEA